MATTGEEIDKLMARLRVLTEEYSRAIIENPERLGSDAYYRAFEAVAAWIGYTNTNKFVNQIYQRVEMEANDGN